MKQIALHVGPDVGLCVSLVREDLTCRVLCRPMCIRCRVLCQYGALHVGSYVGLCVSYVGSFVKWHTHVGSYVGPMSVLCRHVSKHPMLGLISYQVVAGLVVSFLWFLVDGGEGGW